MLKVGIIGCGAVSTLYHAPALRELEAEGLLRVAAAFDPDAGSAAQIGAIFPGAAILSAYDEVFRHDIGLVILASPPRYHAEQAIRALQAGMAVLCEKPMAVTVAEGEAMVEAASVAGQVLAIGLFRRFLPAAQAIRDLLSRGAIGDLQSFHCFEGGPFGWPVRSGSYFDRTTSGGGVLADIGAHLFDLLVWWLGPPVDISYQDDAMGGIEANCRIHLAFDGFEGEVRLSRDWARPNRYVFSGSRGWLSWNANEADRIQMGLRESAHAFDLRLHEGGSEHGLPAVGRAALTFEQSFTDQLRNVVSAIHGTAAVAVPGEEGLKSLRLIEHCYRQRTLLPMPWLSEREQARARTLSRHAE